MAAESSSLGKSPSGRHAAELKRSAAEGFGGASVTEPDKLEVAGVTVCRLHHTPLVFAPGWAFNVCANYPGIGRASERFPNAMWGHSAQPGFEEWELVGLWYCPSCEADRQRWLAAAE